MTCRTGQVCVPVRSCVEIFPQCVRDSTHLRTLDGGKPQEVFPVRRSLLLLLHGHCDKLTATAVGGLD